MGGLDGELNGELSGFLRKNENEKQKNIKQLIERGIADVYSCGAI